MNDSEGDGEGDAIEYPEPTHWADPANKLLAHQPGRH